MQFDREDSGFEPDETLVERLKGNLKLTESELLNSITTFANKIRQNSVIGTLAVNKDAHMQEHNAFRDNSKQLDHEEYARVDLIKKIKAIEFFTLDEVKTKLRRADWLEYVCFTANVPEILKQQNCILSGAENPMDSLLKSAIEFTDVSDSFSVNKIIEEAAAAHILKVKDCQEKIKEGKDPLQNIKGTEMST